ncbi:sensor histidine kinase [Micrococcus lylae]|uniref:histidine kinase n=1 Tax=Micrococcus lylae TaxID=1273 RepID=A0ABY2K1P3_9MICC|nr:histidine kinase [Micrococcus lylae]TFI00013.1 sensor histidine kinase [Micrococcus lylae]
MQKGAGGGEATVLKNSAASRQGRDWPRRATHLFLCLTSLALVIDFIPVLVGTQDEPDAIAASAGYLAACLAPVMAIFHRPTALAVFIVGSLVGPHIVETAGLLTFIAILFLALTILFGSRREMLLAVPALVLWSTSVSLRLDGTLAFLVTYLLFALPTGALASVGRHMRRQAHRAQQRLIQAEADRRTAIRRQREALARELHDVVAHELTVISMLAGARRSSTDVDALQEGLSSTREHAVQGLRELRTLLGVLRAESTQPTPPPAPEGPADAAAVLSDVVHQARALGFDVRTSTPDEAAWETVSRTINESLARILREAFSNILKYADRSAPVVVQVELRPHEVRCLLENRIRREPWQPRSKDSSSRLGVAGLHERAALLGGTAEIGPLGELWRVDVRLPA